MKVSTVNCEARARDLIPAASVNTYAYCEEANTDHLFVFLSSAENGA